MPPSGDTTAGAAGTRAEVRRRWTAILRGALPTGDGHDHPFLARSTPEGTSLEPSWRTVGHVAVGVEGKVEVTQGQRANESPAGEPSPIDT